MRVEISIFITFFVTELEKIENEKSALKRELENNTLLLSEIDNNKHNTNSEKITEIKEEISKIKSDTMRLDIQIENKRAEFKTTNGIIITTICTSCKQDIPHDEIERQKNRKEADLKEINISGKLISEDLKTKKEVLLTKEQELVELEDNLSYTHTPDELAKVDKLKIDNELIINKLSEFKSFGNNNNSISIKEKIERKSKLDKLLAEQDLIGKNNDKIAKYGQEKEKLGESTRISKQCLNALNDIKISFITAFSTAINKNFKKIEINVVDIQKNGSIKETFGITIDKVPYADLNLAGKLEASLELSNFIKDKLNLKMPYIIDNFESYADVDLNIFNNDTQTILIRVEKGAKLEVTQ